MPTNHPPTHRKPAMSRHGIDQLARGGVLTTNEIRRLHGAAPLGECMMLEPGEAFVPLRSQERAHAEFRRRAFECISCGAVLKLADRHCSYCHRPNPGHDHSLQARIEVTTLDDAAPRYVLGWAPPRPLPPAGRFETHMGLVPRKPRRRLVAAVLSALGLS